MTAKIILISRCKVIYTALLLYYILQSPYVSMANKVKIYGALGYFILPLDFIPDFIPVASYTDDLGALLCTLNAVTSNITPEIKAQAKSKPQEWFGEVGEVELDILYEDGVQIMFLMNTQLMHLLLIIKYKLKYIYLYE